MTVLVNKSICAHLVKYGPVSFTVSQILNRPPDKGV